MSDDLVKRLRENGSRSEIELHEDREAAADRIEELDAKLAKAEWLLVDAMVQLREGKTKTRRNRADLIDAFLEELKGAD